MCLCASLYHLKMCPVTPTPSFSPLSFITPVVKRGPEVSSSAVAAHRAGPVQQPCTPLNQALCFQTPQVPLLLPYILHSFLDSVDILHGPKPIVPLVGNNNLTVTVTSDELEIYCYSQNMKRIRFFPSTGTDVSSTAVTILPLVSFHSVADKKISAPSVSYSWD